MRVGMGGLTLWSFRWRSAHGAGTYGACRCFLSMTWWPEDLPAMHGGLNTGLAGAIGDAGAMELGYLAVTALIAVDLWWIASARAAAEGLDQSGCDLGGGN